VFLALIIIMRTLRTQYASVHIRIYVSLWLVLDHLSRSCIIVQNGWTGCQNQNCLQCQRW